VEDWSVGVGLGRGDGEAVDINTGMTATSAQSSNVM
jgi:hypothetical protein